MEIAVREKAEHFAPVIALLLLLVGAAVFGLYLGWALMAGAILFTLDAKRHGRTWEQVGNMLAQGLKKAWIVVQVLLVIGLLTASWISCGAIPCLVRLGALVIRPHVFLLCTFWLCAVMSFLLGTSFGTANTMGVVMMTLARAGGVSLPMTAGAILCGIYVGDRCSPMSSSLLLLSTLTETELYDNVGMTIRSMLVPFVAASGCNQTIAIVLTHAVRKDAYQTLGNQAFARDMSFAGTLAPVLVPWCIAAYTPTSQLDVHGLGWMPFAFWLWFMLLWQGVYAWRMDRKAG